MHWIKSTTQGKRGTWSNNKFYQSKQWRATRNSFIKQNPLCVFCLKKDMLTPANVVDHIKPITEGGAELDINNLQSLCTMHHNQKSAREGNFKKYNKKGGG